MMTEEWTFVARKTKHQKRIPVGEKNSMPCGTSSIVQQNEDIDFDEREIDLHGNKVHKALKELENSGFAQKFVEDVLSALKLYAGKKSANLHEIVCYGLGNVCSSYIARYQFAMLLILWNSLKNKSCDGFSLKCVAFDPAFSNLDEAILRRFGISVLTENEEGRRNLPDSPELKYSLFYMIHCDKFLYDNLIQHNMVVEKISKLVIIGNSFNSMRERLPERVLVNEYNSVHKVLYEGLVLETPLPNWQDPYDVFNDTSIHFFKDTKS